MGRFQDSRALRSPQKSRRPHARSSSCRPTCSTPPLQNSRLSSRWARPRRTCSAHSRRRMPEVPRGCALQSNSKGFRTATGTPRRRAVPSPVGPSGFESRCRFTCRFRVSLAMAGRLSGCMTPRVSVRLAPRVSASVAGPETRSDVPQMSIARTRFSAAVHPLSMTPWKVSTTVHPRSAALRKIFPDIFPRVLAARPGFPSACCRLSDGFAAPGISVRATPDMTCPPPPRRRLPLAAAPRREPLLLLATAPRAAELRAPSP